MLDNVLINKSAALEHCLKRIHEEFVGKENLFRTNFTVQDSILLNLQRACELCIDIANYEIKRRKLGVPQSSRDSFEILYQAGILEKEFAEQMKRMIGFRNLSVHEYESLNLDVVESILKGNLNDFLIFKSTILQKA
jgi:uncharacterized protein YutE (UPF0331/DUF86 family)